jgi:hypothetical protein
LGLEIIGRRLHGYHHDVIINL